MLPLLKSFLDAEPINLGDLPEGVLFDPESPAITREATAKLKRDIDWQYRPKQFCMEIP